MPKESRLRIRRPEAALAARQSGWVVAMEPWVLPGPPGPAPGAVPAPDGARAGQALVAEEEARCWVFSCFSPISCSDRSSPSWRYAQRRPVEASAAPSWPASRRP